MLEKFDKFATEKQKENENLKEIHLEEINKLKRDHEI
jgi:hypothetical protein